MSVGVLASLPVAAAGAILSYTWRGLLWLFGKAAEAPFAALVIAVMAVGSTMAMSNALFMQTMRHPAPLFMDRELLTSSISRNPAEVRRAPSTTARSQPEPASITSVPDELADISREEVKVIQDKLLALGFFEGETDGYYGPQTATAIRAFEKSLGRPPVGALTPEIIESIKKAKLPQPAKKAEVKPATPAMKTMPAASRPDPLTEIVQKVAVAAGSKPVTSKPSTDRGLVSKIQRGLSSLGFLQGKIDGVAGEVTAKAIRNFEVYYNYEVTGAVTPELIDMLVAAGAKV